MAIASITGWLNSPQKLYSFGLALYEQYGENKVLLTLLKSGQGSYHRTKLIAALEELNKKSNLEPKPINIDVVVPVEVQRPGKTSPEYTNAPDKILEIRNEKNLKYAQARKLFESLRVLDSKALRLQAGLQILNLMDFVNDSWAAIDEWQEHGQIRAVEEEELTIDVADLTLEQLLKESRNIPTYITKDRKRLKAAKTQVKQAKISARLQLRETRLKMIKKRLQDEFIQQ